jgi:ribosomal protein S18 acetylase RimI-like enzyme
MNESSGGHSTLRFANHSDAETLVRLINAAFVVEQVAIAGDRIDPLGVEKYMSTGEFLILEEAPSALGCVYVEKRGRRGYLGLLAVNPELQKRGIGRRLAIAAEQYFQEQGCEGIDLRVISARAELIAFYEKLGYLVTGTSPMASEVLLKVPCHYIHMAKSLA